MQMMHEPSPSAGSDARLHLSATQTVALSANACCLIPCTTSLHETPLAPSACMRTLTAVAGAAAAASAVPSPTPLLPVFLCGASPSMTIICDGCEHR